MQGKQHLGFARVASTIEELKVLFCFLTFDLLQGSKNGLEIL